MVTVDLAKPSSQVRVDAHALRYHHFRWMVQGATTVLSFQMDGARDHSSTLISDGWCTGPLQYPHFRWMVHGATSRNNTSTRIGRTFSQLCICVDQKFAQDETSQIKCCSLEIFTSDSISHKWNALLTHNTQHHHSSG